MKRLENKVAVVTGVGSGIGKAIANAFADEGASLGIGDINEDLLSKTTDSLKTKTDKIMSIKTDVSSEDQVKKFYVELKSNYNGVDHLINNAGVATLNLCKDLSVEDWDLMFSINVKGTMLTNQIAYKHMKKSGGGSIINFGSISGLRPEPSASAYSAAKGAVHSWTRTASGTWGKDNIRVNAILPAMATPMYYAARERSTEEENIASHWRNSVPISLGQEYGDPDRDLAPVMVFFASDSSRFITGQLIPVDGGQTAGL